MLKKSKERGGSTVPRTLTSPSNQEIRSHRKVCNNRPSGWLQCLAGDPVCQDPPALGHHTGLICRGFPSPMGAAGERPAFDIKPPLRAPLLIFFRGYLQKSFSQGDTSARQWGFEIRVFPLLGELPKAIESHLHDCQLFAGNLVPLTHVSNNKEHQPEELHSRKERKCIWDKGSITPYGLNQDDRFYHQNKKCRNH